MKVMTEQEKMEQMDPVLKFLSDQFEDAHKSGKAQVHNLLTATAFTLGTLAASSATPKGLGPISGMMIESLVAGIEVGVQDAGFPGTFTVVRRDL